MAGHDNGVSLVQDEFVLLQSLEQRVKVAKLDDPGCIDMVLPTKVKRVNVLAAMHLASGRASECCPPLLGRQRI